MNLHAIYSRILANLLVTLTRRHPEVRGAVHGIGVAQSQPRHWWARLPSGNRHGVHREWPAHARCRGNALEPAGEVDTVAAVHRQVPGIRMVASQVWLVKLPVKLLRLSRDLLVAQRRAPGPRINCHPGSLRETIAG